MAPCTASRTFLGSVAAAASTVGGLLLTHLLLLAPALSLSLPAVAEVAAPVLFERPVQVGESNSSHFWMPSSVFKGADDDLILSIDMAGDGKPCPPPGHPQNCSAVYRSRDSGRSWVQIYGNVPGMALPIPQRGSPGKVRTFNFASKAGPAAGTSEEGFEIFSAMWNDTGAAFIRIGSESTMVSLSGFPPLAGTSTAVDAR